MSFEIERKYLLDRSVDQLVKDGHIELCKEQRIEQTYLAMDSNEEIRVRKIKDAASGEVSYTHTFKRGNGLVREETEYAISALIYEQLMSAFGYTPLTKNRITASWNNQVIEIDLYDQVQLAVLEIEFETLEAANSFEAPAWFGNDISGEKKYSNKKVWRELQAGKFSE